MKKYLLLTLCVSSMYANSNKDARSVRFSPTVQVYKQQIEDELETIKPQELTYE